MDQHQHLVNEYQLILTLSDQMLKLAKEEKWDELVELEVSYLKAVEATTTFPMNETASMMVQNDVRRLLRVILDNENMIKTLLQGRMEQLAELIEKSTRQQQVNTAYGKFGQHSSFFGEHQ
ncbi:flagella biosynthesis regulatory protein FliT [Rahnella rivi]|uniref:flagella biosynthesis regulatory protein FliT n=1 Tax=Rahnella rivi TaxID=2816249 RepID=UPI0039BE5635